jgi:hypothetical protein
MRKRLDVFVVVFLMGALAALVAWPRPSPITPENFDRLATGMRLDEVEAVLGLPGDYSTVPWDTPVQANQIGLYPPEGQNRGCLAWIWSANSYSVTVLSTGDQPRQLIEARLYCNPRPPQGRLENLVWRIKRVWQDWFTPRRSCFR